MLTQREAEAALAELEAWRKARAKLDKRISGEERWWRERHEERAAAQDGQEPCLSAWLFNAVANKHADAMDAYPEPVVLPREPGDAADAALYGEILPALLELGGFEESYSRAWWAKLKHGTAVYGVFWDAAAAGGRGDVAVRDIDVRDLVWEPGVRDLQRSRSVYQVSKVGRARLLEEYPSLKSSPAAAGGDDALLVDWYYKRRAPDGRTLLHFARIAAGQLVYASENEPGLAGLGWYAHGKYPFVFDVLYPASDGLSGFGLIALCRGPQKCIDSLSENVLETSLISSRLRYLISEDTALNEQELLDVDRPLIHVAGRLDDAKIREIAPRDLSGVYLSVLQMKIDELKECSANRDVSTGGVTGGATSGLAITTLQEAANKQSRDMLRASYRAYESLTALVLEDLLQFYTEPRCFRVAGNAWRSVGGRGDPAGPKPVFDLKIRAQKRAPWQQEAQNERMLSLFAAGFFQPERRAEALAALELMDFEGIEILRRRLQAQGVGSRAKGQGPPERGAVSPQG